MRAGLALLLVAAAAPAHAEELSADQWHSRIAEALRLERPLSAQAHVLVKRRGEPDWHFDLEMLRAPHRGGTRTIFELREQGDEKSIVNELVVLPGEPMVNWYWDVQQRRWLAVKGLLATDPWAETGFRFEDLWFTDPAARRRGTVKSVEEQGRRLIELESEPYHYYQRVVTRIDPETALPVRVRFIDNAGAPIREQLFESVEVVDGRPFPKVVRLRDLATGGEDVIRFDRMRFEERIPPSFFDLSVIDQRIRKGVDPVPLDVPREETARQDGI